MVGRTHGQPGAPITFGFKAASWADEIRRHLDRLKRGPTPLAGRPAGRFGGRPGLLRRPTAWRCGPGSAPRWGWPIRASRGSRRATAWSSSPSCWPRSAGPWPASAARSTSCSGPRSASSGNRPRPGAVSSITMPHKRNPERSEHLDTLARLVRANAGAMLEAMVQQHERDGRGWKTEWVALPEVCLLQRRRVAAHHRDPVGPRGRHRADGGQRGGPVRFHQLRAGAGRPVSPAGQAPGPGPDATGAATGGLGPPRRRLGPGLDRPGRHGRGREPRPPGARRRRRRWPWWTRSCGATEPPAAAECETWPA